MKHLTSLTFILFIQLVFTYFSFDNDTLNLYIVSVHNADRIQKIFKLYPMTKVLTIKNTTLKEFPANCKQFKDLERVVFIENKYTKDFSNLKECSNITELFINNCNNIPNCLDTLTKLRYLNLKNNCLITFPNEVLGVKSLEVLNLSVNFLFSIPKDIAKLSNLHTLFLSRNSITSIHNLVAIPNLCRLALHANGLLNIPIEIGLLTHLSYLDLSGNKIKEWHSSEEQLNSFFNVLITEQCNIPSIYSVQNWENGLFNLHNLEYLKITDNCIEDISPDLSYFQKLQCIDLAKNLITSIPTDLKMDSLTFLDLQGNDLQWGLQEFVLLNPNTYVNLI